MKAPLALWVALACLPSAALAEDGNRVLLTKLGGEQVDDTLAAQVDVGLRAEMKKVIAARLIDDAPAAPAGCEEGACAAKLASTHQAALVVIAVVRQADPGHKLVARLVDAEGNRIIIAERAFDATPDYLVLRGLATQLLVPGEYTGTVRLTDIPAGAQVVVDGIPLSQEELSAPVALSVGTHEVAVEAQGLEPRVQELEIEFSKKVELSLAPPPPVTASANAVVAQPSIWPTAVAGGVTGVAALALVGSIIDFVAMGIFLDGYYQVLEDRQSRFAPRTFSDRLAASLDEWGVYQRARRNDVVLIGVTGGITLVAAAATAALAADLALRPPPEDQE